jgi:hypothetical protein
MSLFKKIFIFILVFLLLTQFTIPFFIPSTIIYNERIVYDAFKNNEFVINTTIQQIKSIIKKDNLKNYIIILGDSVGYSTPCLPENSIGHYMNLISKREGKDIRVFNLSVPSMMVGDIFTMIKLLDSYGISTQNLIIDFCYWEFFASKPVFWLNTNLKSLDPKEYIKMVENKKIEKDSPWVNVKNEIKNTLFTKISIIKYSEFLKVAVKKKVNFYLKEAPTPVTPWYTKKDLPATMKKPENTWYYSDKPFQLDDSNPQIYFLNKIIDMQKGKNTLIFLTAMNDKLLSGATSKPGFIENMKKIDNYFSDKDVKFVNYNKKIDYNNFSDHVHLIQEGYRILSEDLWKRINI